LKKVIIPRTDFFLKKVKRTYFEKTVVYFPPATVTLFNLDLNLTLIYEVVIEVYNFHFI